MNVIPSFVNLIPQNYFLGNVINIFSDSLYLRSLQFGILQFENEYIDFPKAISPHI